MFKRVLCSILASAALVLSPATEVLAGPATPPTSTEAIDVLTVAADQSEASTTRPMPADICAFTLVTHPGHTNADCVTHYTVRIERAAASKVGSSAPLPGNLAYSYCPTVTGTMWNLGWYSTVSQAFCVTPPVYVVALPGYTRCNSSWWIRTTWCGVGANTGWYADGGDNVLVPGVPTYSASLRVWMNAYGYFGVRCWGAFC